MNGSIYKFEREMLGGTDISVQKKRDRSWHKKHWHNYFEIIYFKNCEGTCVLNGVERKVKGSCLFFQTPKDFHEIATEEREGSYSIIVSFSEQMIDKHLLSALTSEPIVLYGLPSSLASKLDEMYTVFGGQSSYKERHLKHLLNCVLIDILEIGQPLTSELDDIHPIVRESISYMLTNPSENITLETFSQKFGISKTYFSHLFRDSTGICFKQYLVSLRMECAKRMLLENELPIIDVGFECGFFTPSQFVRSFKQHTGMTPSAYRASFVGQAREKRCGGACKARSFAHS